MDGTTVIVAGILSALVGAVVALLVAWTRYRSTMSEVETAAAAATAQIKKDAHEQVVISFQGLLETASQQLVAQRTDLIAALDRQRQDTLVSHREDRDYHQRAQLEIVARLTVMTEHEAETAAQLEKMAEHVLANREFTKFLHDYLLRQQEEKKS